MTVPHRQSSGRVVGSLTDRHRRTLRQDRRDRLDRRRGSDHQSFGRGGRGVVDSCFEVGLGLLGLAKVCRDGMIIEKDR